MSPPFYRGSKKNNKGKPFAPRQVGTELRPVPLTGGFFAGNKTDGHPVLFQMPERPFFYLMCFTYVETLKTFHLRAEVPFDSIKRIDDGHEFLEESEFDRRQIRIGLDPWFSVTGTVRYTEIQWS